MLRTLLWFSFLVLPSQRFRSIRREWVGTSHGTRRFGTDFNWDFNVSLDEAVTPVIYNVSNLNLTDATHPHILRELRFHAGLALSPHLPVLPDFPIFLIFPTLIYDIDPGMPLTRWLVQEDGSLI
jgi:hypothetical protein